MTEYNGIIIRNIFYMLCYAFEKMRPDDEAWMNKEEFTHLHDLLAAILAHGMSHLVKQGLYREYVECNETLSTLKGKLDLPSTIRHRVQRKQVLACQFDEFSENNLLNQILKTTAHHLVLQEEVDPKQRDTLKKLLFHFGTVDIINPRLIQWKRLQYQRNNQRYRPWIQLCEFIWQHVLFTTESGEYRIKKFTDDNMADLFERFVRNYYKQHYTNLSISRKFMHWNFTKPLDSETKKYLPIMKTDITLYDKHHNKTLIIDTKFYRSNILQTGQHGNKTFRSDHLYQIFAYVKNQDKGNTGNVSGILLYAKTTEEDVPDNTSFVIGNNHFCVRTLDLNQPFEQIKQQLDMIAQSYFGAVTKQ